MEVMELHPLAIVGWLYLASVWNSQICDGGKKGSRVSNAEWWWWWWWWWW